ncbi:MAG: cytochrome P450 [Acidimicrobiia bacterium]|nr:cytochrome P450 [Acidimicrobiia bacterium]
MVDVDEVQAVEAEILGAFVSPEARHDPYPLYAELRATSPMLDSGVGLWLLTRHHDVRRVLRDPRFSSDESRSLFNQAMTELNDGQPPHPIDEYDLMLFMDPPDHTRLRRLVAGSFTPRRVAELRPRIGEITDQLLEAADPAAPFDVVAGFAYPLATQVICELLGVPVEDREVFGGWSTAMARGVDPSAIRTPEVEAALEDALAAFRDYFEGLIARRRADPGDDLLSALIAAEDEGDRLSHDELLATGVLLLIAGHETTVNLIGNGVLALLRDGAAVERLRRDPALLPAAIDELLRYDAPVQLTQRVAIDDVDWDDRVIPAGTALILLLGAANRDPAAFAHPDELVFDRPDNPHVAFGGGIHHCLGAALARTEGEVTIGSLLATSPALTLVEEPVRRPTFTLRGLDHLVVTRA